MSELTEVLAAARLRQVVSRLVKLMRRDASSTLTPSMLSALSTIEDQGALRISALAAAESVDPSVATRLVAALEERGYLERRDDPEDRRACLVDLTAPGRESLEAIWRERSQTLARRLEKLSEADRRTIEGALGALERLLND